MKTIKETSYHRNYYPQEKVGICVVRRKGETFEELMKRFRKKYSKSGIAKEFHDKMYYEKPSDKRRRKRAQSIRLLEREAKKAEELKQKRKKFRKQKAKLDAKKQKKENNQ